MIINKFNKCERHGVYSPPCYKTFKKLIKVFWWVKLNSVGRECIRKCTCNGYTCKYLKACSLFHFLLLFYFSILLPLMQFYNNIQQSFLCSWCVAFGCKTLRKWQVECNCFSRHLLLPFILVVKGFYMFRLYHLKPWLFSWLYIVLVAP